MGRARWVLRFSVSSALIVAAFWGFVGIQGATAAKSEQGQAAHEMATSTTPRFHRRAHRAKS